MLTKGVDPAEVIIATEDGVDLMPATIELARAEAELLTRTGREHVIKTMIETLDEDGAGYDWVLLDCPPSLGVMTVAALTAADGVLIPLQCETLSHRGVGQLLDTVHDVRRFTNRKLEVWGVLPTLYDGRTNHARTVLETISETYDLEVIEPPIPKTIKFAEAPAAGRSILATSRSSKGARAYREAAENLVARSKRPEGAQEEGGSRVVSRAPRVPSRRTGAAALRPAQRARGLAGGDRDRGARVVRRAAVLDGDGGRGSSSASARTRPRRSATPSRRRRRRPAERRPPATRRPARRPPSRRRRPTAPRRRRPGATTPRSRPTPATGKRVVFSQGRQRVWLVGDDEQGRSAPTWSRAASTTTSTPAATRSTRAPSRPRASTTPARCSTSCASPRATAPRSASTTSRSTTASRVQTMAQLGTPLSHGCIRQKTADAIALWDFAPLGTDVVVTA